MKNFFFYILIAVAALLGGHAVAQDIMITNAIAAPSPTSQSRTGAVYLSIMNMGKENDDLVSISTPVSASAMLHESKDDNGVMKMEMRDQLEIPAGKTIDILPGHMHIMLVGLKAPLKIGDNVPLEMTFKKSGKVFVDAIVGKTEGLANMKHTN